MPHGLPGSVTDRAEAHLAHWYALRTRSNRERTCERDLNRCGIASFLPTYRVESRWSDRVKILERPLFPGYLFVCATAAELERATHTRGVVSVLGSNLHPTAIADAEIAAVRQVANTHMNIEPCAYTVGERVTVETGSLAGVSGVIQRTKGARRLVVSVDILGRAVSVELDADTVTSA